MASASPPPPPPPSAPRRADVLVVGEALVDLFPQASVIGGAPFNVARNLAALGAAPLMLTRIGRDAIGEQLQAEFARHGLSTAALQHDDTLPSGQVRVHPTADGGHRFEIPPGQAWDALDTAAALAATAAAAPRSVYFGTLAQRAPASARAVRAVVQAARSAGARVMLDLNLRDGPDNRALAEASLPLADGLKVNDEELPQLLRWFVPSWAPAAVPPGQGSDPGAGDGADPAHPALGAAVAALMAQFQLSRLVLTCGARGHAVFDHPGGLVAQGPSAPVVLQDTVGAGDAFMSVVLLGEARGWPLATTLQRAAAFAAAVCGIKGAVSTDPDFYARWRAAWADAAAPSSASSSAPSSAPSPKG